MWLESWVYDKLFGRNFCCVFLFLDHVLPLGVHSWSLAPCLGKLAFDHQKQGFGPNCLQSMTTNILKAHTHSTIIDSICSNFVSYEFAHDVLNHTIPDCVSCLRSKGSSNDYNKFNWRANLKFQNNLLYIPNDRSWLQTLWHYHDMPMVGNFGVFKTLDLVSRSYHVIY